MSTTVRYNGSVLATINNATRILNTRGKWVEHDIAIENTSSGGSVPSATQHTILFEFEDTTSASITAYYDSAFISDAITATTPTSYNNKTVERALLDGTAWYIKPSETWETLLEGNITWNKDDNGDYPFCWIPSLGSIPITVGSVWRVTYNNTEYRCTGRTASVGGQNFNIFGNPVWVGDADDGSSVPFVFIDYTRYNAWSGGLDVPNVNSSYYFKIERLVAS